MLLLPRRAGTGHQWNGTPAGVLVPSPPAPCPAPGQGHGHQMKTLARASAPALAMSALLGWQATAWMASSCFLRCAVISCTHVLLSRLHRRSEQSWPAGQATVWVREEGCRAPSNAEEFRYCRLPQLVPWMQSRVPALAQSGHEEALGGPKGGEGLDGQI